MAAVRRSAKRIILTTREVPILPRVTHAEQFYYEKQIEAGTTLRVVLRGHRILVGRLLWHDSTALGIDDHGTEVVVLKGEIRYLWKEEAPPPRPAHGNRRIQGGRAR